MDGLIGRLEICVAPWPPTNESREIAHTLSFHLNVGWDRAHNFLTSIDAVVALIAERLPLEDWDVSRQNRDGEPLFVAYLGDEAEAVAKTAPCALLIAALKAMDVQP